MVTIFLSKDTLTYRWRRTHAVICTQKLRCTKVFIVVAAAAICDCQWWLFRTQTVSSSLKMLSVESKVWQDWEEGKGPLGPEGCRDASGQCLHRFWLDFLCLIFWKHILLHSQASSIKKPGQTFRKEQKIQTMPSEEEGGLLGVNEHTECRWKWSYKVKIPSFPS